MLDFDSDCASVSELGAMYLADRSAGEGRLVEVAEQLVERLPKVLFDRPLHLRRAGGHRMVTQLTQRGLVHLAIGLGDDAVDVARNLTDFCSKTAHSPEDLGRALRGSIRTALAQETHAGACAHRSEHCEARQLSLRDLTIVRHARASIPRRPRGICNQCEVSQSPVHGITQR